MDGTIAVFTFMLCVVCSLDAGRLLMVVSAQPTVDAVILTPPVDRRVGGQVDVRCVAMNLEPDHIVEWAIKDPDDNNIYHTLRWGNSTVTHRAGYQYTTTQTNGVTTQDFTIVDLQSSDAAEYKCNVLDPISTGGNNILAIDIVTLFVLDSNFQFPDNSFPMCSPDGPITVDSGTELNMRCSSEGMNSVIMMGVSQIPPVLHSFTWTPSNTACTLSMSLDLTADETHDGVSFECVISLVPYPEVRHSCNIGPISVRAVTEATTTVPTNEPLRTCSSTALIPWITLFVVAIALFAVSLSVNILLVRRVLHQKQLNTSIAERKTAPTPEPYMELQPIAKQNSDYMEPVRETTPGEHAYINQTVQEENEAPEYESVKPEGD